MNVFKLLMLAAFLIFTTACGTDQPDTETKDKKAEIETKPEEAKTPSYVDKVQKAHAHQGFLKKPVVQFDFQLTFGGKERMKGTITLLTNSNMGKIALENGQKIIYHKDRVFYSPDMDKKPQSIRFDAYTWPYFFLLPYKLSDPGTVWQDYPNNELNGKTYDAQKLSFEPGTGDAPDDWYILYADSQSYLIDVAAYIVTANKSQAKAEEDPHAIQYLDYQPVEGIPIATRWLFWEWREAGGLTKELGSASISNLHFIEVEEGLFEVPEGFEEV